MVPLRELKIKSAVRVENKEVAFKQLNPKIARWNVMFKKWEMKWKVESLKLISPLNRLNSMFTQYLKIQLLDQQHLYSWVASSRN